MERRSREQLNGWEQELADSMLNSLHRHLETLCVIHEGTRIVLPEIGDVTRDEERKAEWLVAHYKAALFRIEYNLSNDNDPPMDEELADLIAGEW